MRILVTGSSGFIGSFIVDKLLEKGYKVTGIDIWFNEFDLKHQLYNSHFEFVKGSILGDKLISPLISDSDVVIHMAGILGTSETLEKYDIHSVAETNIMGTIKILKLIQKHEIGKIILPSVPDVPWLNPYKITKSSVEEFVKLYHKYFNLNTIILRLSNVYGPRERWINANLGAPYNYQKVVPTFIMHALQNEPLTIYGNGEQMADYIYIDDVTEAFYKAIIRDNIVGKTIPVGYGRSISVNMLADTILQLTNSKSQKIYSQMRKGEVPLNISVNTKFMQEALGFKPIIDLVTGLKRTIPYYKEKISM
ncbi:MAG: NAD-dependent epimerase/dehydratase family protein [Thermoproteales archaeon]|nr:NAD-dependent epimerase/dehydratase family protein [Thermoproteales archaeon]